MDNRMHKAIYDLEFLYQRKLDMSQQMTGQSEAVVRAHADSLKLALDALREKQQRENQEACEYCNFHDTRGYIATACGFPIIYCPLCVRKLEADKDDIK